MPLGLSDEQLDLLSHMAEPLAPSHRSAFLEAVTARLPTSRDAIGLGSLHRTAAGTRSKTRVALARDEEPIT
jgi:hypothetical protein